MPDAKTPRKTRLTALRAVLKKNGLAGFIVPRADEYQGENVPPCAGRLQWLTGFSGSAGVAVVLADKAVVMSDGRYTIQLAQQVDSALFATGNSVTTGAGDWLADNAAPGDVIGYDPWLHTPAQLEKIGEPLKDKNISLRAVDKNPLDEAWKDRPYPPEEPAEIFPEEIAGLPSGQKRRLVAESLVAADIGTAILTLPDSIAWLLNVRGNDIPYTPVVLSYATIDSSGHMTWFVDPQKIDSVLRDHVGDAVKIAAPDTLDSAIDMLAAQGVQRRQAIGLDFKRSPVWFRQRLEGKGARVVDFKDPCIAPKAIKNEAEQAGIRAAHLRDGVALTSFLAWFDREAPKGRLNEISVAEKLEDFRREDPAYRGPSFPTIAGFGPNGAIVHYRAEESSARPVEPPGLLLLDSGAQYKDGTTDITRTIAVGDPTAEQKTNFTLVLKGHIAVASARFAPGTKGSEIDALARKPLQERGLDYAHGTGHGVGCYLAVHEEAASLSMRGQEPVEPGMLISNEPGYYREDAYGIRTESLVLAHEADGRIGFETVSLAPIDRRLIDAGLLSGEEKAWVNEYHKTVRRMLELKVDEPTRLWLEQATDPIE